jgi:glucan phosphoethanolaminetransferase (alkaline phosphatase superfamily)
MTPKVRQILYVVGVVAFALLTVLSATRVIDGQTAASVSAALTAVLGLFGVTVSGVAYGAVTKQQHNGTFDAPASPADQVVTGINAVIAQAEQAQAEVERVKDAVSTAVQDIPILGPLAQQAIDRLP